MHFTTPTSSFYEELVETTEELLTPFTKKSDFGNSSSLLFDQNVSLVPIADRMDTVDISDDISSKFSSPTGNFETLIGKTMYGWHNDRPEKAKIVRVNSEDIKREKLKTVKTEGFIPYLKRVQDELISNSHKNLRGKIGMLRRLRDDMLFNIDEKINQLWGRKSSEARGHKEDDYDMHFPSNEGALMTIGFLTFAVFLIKLILKLVQTLKDKHSMTMAMSTMMTNTNAALIGRRKRDTSFDEQSKILQLIEEYSFT
ncbi:hypothetical protein WA026_022397 [Henosepilachna vigintioctopunctata]|uniref:Uncharacterized protein n=1 Tax=Henosepilachna vigintioctopunctata TaxID=420089 RepID=A0AAW1U7H3_9CUCU